MLMEVLWYASQDRQNLGDIRLLIYKVCQSYIPISLGDKGCSNKKKFIHCKRNTPEDIKEK